MKVFLLILLCFFFAQVVFAQETLSGRVFENKTKVYLIGISVENLRTHSTTVSDSTGKISIKTAIGDYICFSGFSYLPDTLYVVNLKYIEVYLSLKQNMLKEVKVITPEIKTGVLTAPVQTGPLGSSTVQYQTDAAGNYIGGIKIKIYDWDNDKKKRRDNRIIADEQKQVQISGVFNPKNLQNYLPISGQEMQNFIILYVPDIKTYFSSNFNLVVYLNTCYQEFLKIPLEKRQSITFLRLTANQ